MPPRQGVPRTYAPPAVEYDSLSGFCTAVLERLLEARDGALRVSAVLHEADVVLLLHAAQGLLLEQPALLELTHPVKICGDVHGQYDDVIRMFETCGWPCDTNYLFLGDYVDRGACGLETITMLLAYKLLHPHTFFLLRGNHECAGINRIYGFYDECKRFYSVKLWKAFTNVFRSLPVAAVISERIFACHGGLSPELRSVEQIAALQRPAEVRDAGLACDLLWADPAHGLAGWGPNIDRGVSFCFGADVVEAFLKQHDLDLVVRAHQVVEAGYDFFAGRRLVTLFTAPNYCNEFNNAGAVMSVDDEMTCAFQILPARAVACPGRRYPLARLATPKQRPTAPPPPTGCTPAHGDLDKAAPPPPLQLTPATAHAKAPSRRSPRPQGPPGAFLGRGSSPAPSPPPAHLRPSTPPPRRLAR